MKRNIFIKIIKAFMAALLLALAIAAPAQEFYLTGNAGLSSLGMKTLGVSWLPGFSSSLGGGYHFYFGERFFIGFGPEMSIVSGGLRASTLSDSYRATDEEGEAFILRYSVSRLRERDRTWMLRIPLTANLLLGAEQQWYATAGFSVGAPFGGKYRVTADGMDAIGDFSDSHGDPHVEGPLFAGFGHFDALKGKGKLPLKASFDLLMEFGLRKKLSERWTLLAGLFLTVGLNDIRSGLPSGRPIDYERFGAEGYVPGSLTATTDGTGQAYMKKLSTMSFGLRVRFLFGRKKPEVIINEMRREQDSLLIDSLQQALMANSRLIDSLRQVMLADTAMMDSLQRAPQPVDILPDSLRKPLLKPEMDTRQLLDSLQPRPGIGVVLHRVNFAFGKTELSPRAKVELQQAVNWLIAHPKVEIQIVGHTDNTGNEMVNQYLSAERAKAAYRYVKEHGVAVERLSFRGSSSRHPIATNETAEGRALNRSVEMLIVKCD